jgi:hypothetical protein
MTMTPLQKTTRWVFEQQSDIYMVNSDEAIMLAMAYANWLSVYTGKIKETEAETADAMNGLAEIMLRTALASHRRAKQQEQDQDQEQNQ